jgi:hypothetical protein
METSHLLPESTQEASFLVIFMAGFSNRLLDLLILHFLGHPSAWAFLAALSAATYSSSFISFIYSHVRAASSVQLPLPCLQFRLLFRHMYSFRLSPVPLFSRLFESLEFCKHAPFEGIFFLLSLLLLVRHISNHVFYAHLTQIACCVLFRPLINPEDGGSTFLQNVGELLLAYKASHPRKQHSSVTDMRTSNSTFLFCKRCGISSLTEVLFICSRDWVSNDNTHCKTMGKWIVLHA